jgi:hypothetical protein
MRYVKITFRVLVVLLVGSFLHYVLPQHDLARITSTEVIRTDLSGWNRIFYAQADSGGADLATRDLRLINTQRQKAWLFGFVPREAEGVMVYRNEDSGWIWPPYFKFDSSDLQAEAAASISPPGQENWVVITHYGWRNRFLSIYPNAVGIRPVEGPDVRIIPWFNIFFFVFLGLALLFLRAAWMQFRERMMDPALEKAGDRWDEIEAGAAEKRSRLRRWFARLGGK